MMPVLESVLKPFEVKNIKKKMATLEVQLGLKRYWLHDRTFLKLQGNFESAWKNANLLGYFQITNDSNAEQPVYKPSFKYNEIIRRLKFNQEKYLKLMNSVFEKLIKIEKFIFISRQKISVGK